MTWDHGRGAVGRRASRSPATSACATTRVTARVTHEVWIRHRGDVVPAMRFTAGARILDIVAVLTPPPAATASSASAKNGMRLMQSSDDASVEPAPCRLIAYH